MFLLDQLKALPLFQPPEVTLKRKLEDNPTYPFEPVLLSSTDQYPGWWGRSTVVVVIFDEDDSQYSVCMRSPSVQEEATEVLLLAGCVLRVRAVLRGLGSSQHPHGLERLSKQHIT